MSKAKVTIRLDKARLAQAQKLLRAKTATEAIEKALDLATEKAAHDAVLRKYSGVGRKDSFANR